MYQMTKTTISAYVVQLEPIDNNVEKFQNLWPSICQFRSSLGACLGRCSVVGGALVKISIKDV